jgi:hypothetical protein
MKAPVALIASMITLDEPDTLVRCQVITLFETQHSTQKPVECMRRPMQNNSSPGQAVYDPFLGSGTTLIAAETIARACFCHRVGAGLR